MNNIKRPSTQQVGRNRYEDQEQQQYYTSDDNLDPLDIRLPNLSDILNIKTKTPIEKDLHETLQRTLRQAQTIEKLLVYKHKQIQQYEFMIQSLQLALQKRDQIISEIRQENIILKDLNIELRDKNQRYQNEPLQKRQLKQAKSLAGDYHSMNSKDSPSLMNPNSKRLMRARTKENNFDESLQNILDQQYGKHSYFLNTFQQKDHMAQYIQQYQDLQHLQAIKGMVQSEEQFVNTVQKLDFTGIVNIFDSLMLVLQEHKSLFQNVIKQRKLLQCTLTINEHQNQNEQFIQINKTICDALDCDKNQIYVFDNENQELWTKNYKTDQIIRIGVNEDIVGLCYTNQQPLIVHNAYNDTRFNKQLDQKNNYKTQNLLLCPIFDKSGNNAIGVIQAINKNNSHFNSDDQTFLTSITQIVSVLLRSQQLQDEAITIQNALRNLINV